MKQQSAFFFTLLIAKEDVVQPPRRVQPGNFRAIFLLPVEPEEVDPLPLERMDDVLQVIRREVSVGDIEGYVLLRRRIYAGRSRHFRIAIIPRLYPTRWMEVHRSLESLLMKAAQESIGVRK